MRDPARIDAMLEVLEVYWRLHPDLRLGQLVSTCLPAGVHDPYYIEDEVIAAKLTQAVLDQLKGPPRKTTTTVRGAGEGQW